jgi:hypothetical protein
MICFRTATLEDLHQILPIYENARAFMRQLGNPNQWRDHHPAVEILREDIQKGQLYLCLENEEIAASTDWFTWDGTPQNGWDSGAWETRISGIMTMMVQVRNSVPAALRALILGGALPIKPAGVTAYYSTIGA